MRISDWSSDVCSSDLLMPIMWMAKMVNATLAPPCSISGGYIVQPPAGAPPGRNNVPSSMMKADGRNKNDHVFMGGSAMSGAPLCRGVIQLHRPQQGGKIGPQLLNSACEGDRERGWCGTRYVGRFLLRGGRIFKKK